jgi:REP element-mobilizing transposase RayT
MGFNHLPQRRSIRLKGFDYAQAGAYFVTICSHERELLFGSVIEGKSIPNHLGNIVIDCWELIPIHFPNIILDAFILMPNHIHGVIMITEPDVGAGSPRPASTKIPSGAETAPLQRPALGQIIAYFKYKSTKQINQKQATPGSRVWQRNYFEHIIRTEKSPNAVRNYTEGNPLRWDLDRYNPKATGQDPEALNLWNLLTTERGINPI